MGERMGGKREWRQKGGVWGGGGGGLSCRVLFQAEVDVDRCFLTLVSRAQPFWNIKTSEYNVQVIYVRCVPSTASLIG